MSMSARPPTSGTTSRTSTRLAGDWQVSQRLGPAVQVQRHVPGAARSASACSLAVMLNRSRFEKIARHHLPDADDDGAGRRRPRLVLPLQRAPSAGTTGCCRASASSAPTRSWASPGTAMLGIVIVDVWQWTPLITLITLAGLKRVPQDQLEANMVDGAGRGAQLLRDHAAQSLSRSC